MDRLAGSIESDEVIVTAGGSTYFDVVADELAGWERDRASRQGRPGARRRRSVAGVRAVLTMGRRDVSFDQDLPVPYGLSDSRVTKLNDQHAYLHLGKGDRGRAAVGAWLEFGISHPCTLF